MKTPKLIPLILIPVLLAGQSDQLSLAARRLLEHPRSGEAELTWADGRKAEGYIRRVTDQFVSFSSVQPFACENVPLTNITAVQWLHTSNNFGARELGEAAFLFTVLSPFFVAHEIADPIHRMAPPLHHLKGNWASIQHPGESKSSFTFGGSKVQYAGEVVRKGRYSVEQGHLRLIFEEGPETVTTVRFDCDDLILENVAERFQLRSGRDHVTGPLVGTWSQKGVTLELEANGVLVERRDETRTGIFEKTAKNVKIHWAGGEEWIAQVKHHHLFVRVGGVLTEYRYVPPDFLVDL
jgi:hypothetical protein